MLRCLHVPACTSAALRLSIVACLASSMASGLMQHAVLQTYYPLLKAGERFPRYDPMKQPCLEPRPEDDAVFLQGMLEGMADIEVGRAIPTTQGLSDISAGCFGLSMDLPELQGRLPKIQAQTP